MGSSLFFWKWPQQYQAWSRKGQPHYAMDNFPQFLRPQYPSKTEEDRTNIKNKVDKVRKRLYSEPITVVSITHRLYVRIGSNDIWIFYNSTSCGSNLALWEPHFGLPIVQHILRALLPGSSQCDMDVG